MVAVPSPMGSLIGHILYGTSVTEPRFAHA
jgi:hypothetical protein